MSEYNVKHLEMIQAIIERMGNNSFIIKGWSFTSIGALFAFGLVIPVCGIYFF